MEQKGTVSNHSFIHIHIHTDDVSKATRITTKKTILSILKAVHWQMFVAFVNIQTVSKRFMY